MGNSITSFKTAFGGGTRANRFEVVTSFPVSVGSTSTGIAASPTEAKFKIFATSLPKAEVGTIQVPYRGRLLNFAGDRAYGFWTISVYDDSGTKNLWKAFNRWKEILDGHKTHEVLGDDFAYNFLQTDWILNQLDLNGAPGSTSPLRTITLRNCWPSQVSNLDFDMAKADQSIFSVVLTYDWFEITEGI